MEQTERAPGEGRRERCPGLGLGLGFLLSSYPNPFGFTFACLLALAKYTLTLPCIQDLKATLAIGLAKARKPPCLSRLHAGLTNMKLLLYLCCKAATLQANTSRRYYQFFSDKFKFDN